MNNVELFNYWYSLFGGRATIKILGNNNEEPTQSDKPSPHSNYSKQELWRRARKSFPEDNISIFEVANTNSMEPLFDDNCQVIMEDVSVGANIRQPLVEGDIVVYESNGGLIIHRLTEQRLINNDIYWLLRGDNNFLPDGWIKQSRIKYRLVGVLYGSQERKGD
jgi:hypothetical protein